MLLKLFLLTIIKCLSPPHNSDISIGLRTIRGWTDMFYGPFIQPCFPQKTIKQFRTQCVDRGRFRDRNKINRTSTGGDNPFRASDTCLNGGVHY